MMKYLLGFVILTGFFLLGMFLHGLGVPIPGGVLGLILFFLALQIGLIKLKWVERAAGLMLRVPGVDGSLIHTGTPPIRFGR